jgi:hypothetical protein
MSTKPSFAVRRLAWDKPEHERDYYRVLPKATSVAVFATFPEADEDRARRETEARSGVNPFRYGGAALFYQTSFDAPRLHDWLLDGRIEPPSNPTGHLSWARWWEASVAAWGPDPLAHVWQALDKVRFFEVVVQFPVSKVYVVSEINWTWNDEPHLDADTEGGKAVRAFRNRELALAECDRLNDERRQQSEYQGYFTFDYRYREGKGPSGDGPRLDIRAAVFFEVVELEVGDEP